MGTEHADAEDPRASAELLADSLTDDQLHRYVGSRDRREAVLRLTRERRDAGEMRPHDTDLTDGLRQEYREAKGVVDAALGPVWKVWQVLSGTVFVLSGWLFLGCGLLAILVGLFTGSFTQVFRAWDGWRWRFDDVGPAVGLLLALSTVGFAVAVVVMAASAVADAVRDRRSRPILLEWAVARPGQLGRGLPALEGAGSSGSVLRAMLGVVLVIGVVVAAFAVPVSAVTLLTSLLGFELEWFLTCLAFFAGSLLLARVMLALFRHLTGRHLLDERTRTALSWRWADADELRRRRRA